MVNKIPEGRISPTPAQLRAARAALDWSIKDVADLTSLGVNTIRRAEDASSGVRLTDANACRLIEIFSQNGVEFAPEVGGRVGVLFRT